LMARLPCLTQRPRLYLTFFLQEGWACQKKVWPSGDRRQWDKPKQRR
jgi:hypothetical protein